MLLRADVRGVLQALRASLVENATSAVEPISSRFEELRASHLDKDTLEYVIIGTSASNNEIVVEVPLPADLYKGVHGKKLHKDVDGGRIGLLHPETRLRSQIEYHKELLSHLYAYERAEIQTGDDRRKALISLQFGVRHQLEQLEAQLIDRQQGGYSYFVESGIAG